MAGLSDYTTEYVRHALALIRVANGLNADANSVLSSLGRDLRKVFAGENLADLGVRDLRALIKQADQIIADAFAEIADSQYSAVADVIQTEATWALNVAEWNQAPTDQAIQRAISQFTVMGSDLGDELSIIRDRMQASVASTIRLGAGAGLSDSDILTGITGAGGSVDASYRALSALVDASTLGAADTGRRVTMKANNVTAVQWHTILDPKVCPDCAERADQVWTIDGDPVGHDIPYLPIPMHPWCRCIFLPLEMDTQELDQVEQDPPTRFADWLDTLTQDEQDALLGEGRAELWRDGTITLADLIDQNGYVMSLADLKESIK